MYFFFRKRACNLGLNSHHCALADLDNQLQSREWLSNGHSPGKRTTLKEEHKEKLSEVEIKRYPLRFLTHFDICPNKDITLITMN